MPRLSYCAEQVRRFDNDRFICSLFAPPDEREALAAIHAYNLEVARIREIAREPLLGHMRLQWWRDAMDPIYAGQPPRHQIAVAVAEAVSRFGLSRGHFDRLLDARALDLDDAAPQTLAALIEYADATSATLAALSLEILGEAGEAPRKAARDVGIAWALTGILRAVPFHAQARRVYLPAELNREAGLDVALMFERGPTAGLPSVVATISGKAREFLRSARGYRAEVSKKALPALFPATLAEFYLRRLSKSGFNPFDTRIQAAGPSRLFRVAFNRVRQSY
jgi:phytoene synthase